jgi:hypothetical protein
MTCGYCDRPLTAVQPGLWECARCRPILRTLGADIDFRTAGSFDQWHRVWDEFLREAAASSPRRECPGQASLL